MSREPFSIRSTLRRRVRSPADRDVLLSFLALRMIADALTLQWQKIALARSLMKPENDLLCWDEPAASLDALAESALFGKILQKKGTVRRRVCLTKSSSNLECPIDRP